MRLAKVKNSSSILLTVPQPYDTIICGIEEIKENRHV